MFSITLFLILTTSGLANPFPRPQTTDKGIFARCEQAVNCETYTDVSGQLRARFGPGIEPGSEDYEHRATLAKRDSPNTFPNTEVSFGDDQISWGCGVDPVATMNNLSSICSDGSCEGDPYDLSIISVSPLPGGMAGASGQKLEIAVTDGSYPKFFRDGLIQAVQLAMSAQGVVTWDRAQRYSEGTLGECDTGTQAHPPAGSHGQLESDYRRGPSRRDDLVA